MTDKKKTENYRVVEVFRRGEKIYKGKQYRVGWIVYTSNDKGEAIYKEFLPEDK